MNVQTFDHILSSLEAYVRAKCSSLRGKIHFIKRTRRGRVAMSYSERDESAENGVVFQRSLGVARSARPMSLQPKCVQNE